MNKLLLCAAALLLVVPHAAATSFVIPDDDELLAKSSAVVIATVERASVQAAGHEIETNYDVRVERALKGAARRNDLIRVASPGGALQDRGVVVEGAAHFAVGEPVLLFLTSDGGRWRTTDMTLGKFRFRVSTTGERLLVRDLEDVVGWDRLGRVHHEPIRREEPFLRFLEDRAAGRVPSSTDYFVAPSAVTLELEAQDVAVAASPYPPGTYTVNLNNQPTRWPSPSVVFRKRADQNASGLADGGVSVIQNGLAAWTNECGSNLSLTYGGTTTAVSQNHDGVNVVEFNDPHGSSVIAPRTSSFPLGARPQISPSPATTAATAWPIWRSSGRRTSSGSSARPAGRSPSSGACPATYRCRETSTATGSSTSRSGGHRRATGTSVTRRSPAATTCGSGDCRETCP